MGAGAGSSASADADMDARVTVGKLQRARQRKRPATAIGRQSPALSAGALGAVTEAGAAAPTACIAA